MNLATILKKENGARVGIRTRVKRSAISQDIQATPRGRNMRKPQGFKAFDSCLRVRQIAGNVTCNSVPHCNR